MTLGRRRKKSDRKKNKKMEGVPEVIVKPQDPLSNLPKPLLIGTLILILIITAFVSYFVGSSKSQPVSDQQKEPMVKEADLPLSVSTLQNPVITGWSASVEGILVKKDQGTFTLEKNGKQLIIGIHPKLTSFASTAPKAERKSPLTIEDIPIGSTMQGMAILQNPTSGGLTSVTGERVHIIGLSFVITLPASQ